MNAELNNQEPFTKEQKLLLVHCLLAGVLFQYLFYGMQAVGVSCPIFVGAVYYIHYRFQRPVYSWRKPDAGLLLLCAVILLSLTYVLYANAVLGVLNGLALPLLGACHLAWLSSSREKDWDAVQFARQVIRRIIPDVIHRLPVPFRIASSLLGKAPTANGASADTAGRGSSKLRSGLHKAGIGVAMALPLILILVVLLSAADMMFAELINTIPDQLGDWNIENVIGRLIWFGLPAIYLFCLMWALRYSREGRRDEPGPEQGEGKQLDAVTTSVFLGMINLVYILFAAVQFSYFFGASEGMLPTGTNYAEYARQGFAELVIVTLINLTVLLVVMRFQSKRAGAGTRTVQALLSLLVGCTGVLLVSAFMRMTLYEEAYGYTVMRILVQIFMIYLGLLFIVALYRIWINKSTGSVSLFKIYAAISIIVYVVVNFLPVDTTVAKLNITRYDNTGQIDIVYLGSLSPSVIPVLLELDEREHSPEELHQQLLNLKHEMAGEKRHWVSWNWPEQRARSLLAQRVQEQTVE
ncbi:DUF4173 domain-containing protein [Paenibacillaceae bacterium]|nr:DUF4173 domain-containing protein [Paenibacillaceae bacterium]